MVAYPLVTVAIVFHNEEKALPMLLESFSEVFSAATIEKFKILFINNHSNDRSLKILEAWLQENQRFKAEIINRNENHLAKARSQALATCGSSWLVFIDGDAQLQPRWPENVLQTLNDLPEDVVAVGGRSEYWGDSPWHKYAIAIAEYFPMGKTQSQRVIVRHVPTNNYLVKVEAGLRAGGFDSFFRFVGEDLDFNFRLNKEGAILYEPLFGVDHQLPANIEEWYRKMAQYGRAQSCVLLKNGGGVPLQKFLPLGVCLLFNVFLVVFPACAFVFATITVLIPRTRFFALTFLFYGLGELVGVFKYIYLQMSRENSVNQTHKA